MKLHPFALRAFVVCFSLALGACGGEENPLPGAGGAGGNSPLVEVLEVAPLTLTVGVLEERAIEVRALDAEGNELDVSVYYASTDPEIALVSDQGVVTGRKKGQAMIEVRAGRKGAVVVVTVEGLATTLAVNPDSLELGVGERLRLETVARDADGADLDPSRIVWTSSDPEVVQVDESGELLATGWGEAEVTASISGLTATTAVRTLLRFEELGVGEHHTCGRTPTGVVYCWGSQEQGVLGIETEETSIPAPTEPISEGARFLRLVAGDRHACVLDGDGVVHCWGSNSGGQLGPHRQAFSATPVKIADVPPLMDLWAQGEQTCGLTVERTAICWGGRFDAPEAMEGHDFVELAPGATHVCGRTVQGETLCWGSNDRGQLGQSPETLPESDEPVPVAGIPAFDHIASGNAHVCGIGADHGRVTCWGSNGRGELGRGFTSDAEAPDETASNFAFLSLGVGGRGSCGIMDGAGAHCWGANDFGQSGTAKEEETLTVPEKVVSGNWSFVRIWTGNRHTCAVTDRNMAYCWGDAEQGQLGAPPCAAGSVCPTPQYVFGQR